jgi:hypothetical protein
VSVARVSTKLPGFAGTVRSFSIAGRRQCRERDHQSSTDRRNETVIACLAPIARLLTRDPRLSVRFSITGGAPMPRENRQQGTPAVEDTNAGPVRVENRAGVGVLATSREGRPPAFRQTCVVPGRDVVNDGVVCTDD